MAKVAPFHTKNVEDHKRSPVWHDNDQCPTGKKILPKDKELGQKGNKCEDCIKLDNQT
jgi:hypothetical protein